ncbi:MAG: glutathione S-transferase family protein [Solirubrobacteraceae bacterium]
MKLYSQPGACSTSSHIVLEWAGVPHEVQTITREFKQTPEYLELNPAGVVPTLIDGNFVLTQNPAIYGYIADHAPESGLFGDGSAQQRAEATRWIAYVGSDLHPVFKPLFAPARFGGDGPGADDVRVSALANITQTLELAERRLADREWLAGFRSPADAYLYITLRWATAMGVELTPNLAAFLGRMERDEQVLKALSDEGLETVR